MNIRPFSTYADGRKGYLLALVFGVIYPFGLAPLGWWPLLLVSMFGLIWLLDGESIARARKISFCYGFGFFGVGASWVHVSIHEFGNAPLYLSIFLTLVFVAGLALFKVLVGWSIVFITQRLGQVWFIVGFPIIWFCADLIQGSILTGFPWLFAGYGLIDSWMSGWGRWVGVYGLNYLAALLVAMTYFGIKWLLMRESVRAGWAVIIGSWAIVMVSGVFAAKFDWHSSIEKELEIALVQPNISQEEKWKRQNLSKYLELYDRLSAPYWGYDLIIWPEAAIPSYKHRVERWLQHWQQKAQSSGSHLILGIPIANTKKGEVYASVLSYGEHLQRYDKQHLVPFGEFVPLEKWLRGLIDFFNLPMSSFTAGNSEQLPMSLGSVTLLPAICYEIAYTGLLKNFYNNLNEKSFPLIITISNDAWFGKSWGPHQHAQIARARALEFGAPVLRSTNTGITSIIDAKGMERFNLPQFKVGVLAKKIRFSFAKTLYAECGYFLIFILLILSTLLNFYLVNKLLKNK